MQTTFIAKYKPLFFSDFHFAQNTEFLEVLRGMLSLDRIHLLFIADQDSCKTTLLYAFLREYYGCTRDAPQLQERNIMFINSLREQGINYYRNEMKIFCQSYSIIPGKKKFVVIDDLDTMSEQSQQVFRNQIDKYAHNVNFIAVCSSVQKVIESLQSRLQFFRVLPIGRTFLTSLMYRVAAAEGLYLEQPAAQFLINVCEQRFCRPMLNYLEKMCIISGSGSGGGAGGGSAGGSDITKKRISLAFCKFVCADIHPDTFMDYINKLRRNDLMAAINVLFSLHNQGFSVLDILDYFFSFVKLSENLLSETEKYRVVPYLCKYITVFHNIDENKIELAFFTNNLMREFLPVIAADDCNSDTAANDNGHKPISSFS